MYAKTGDAEDSAVRRTERTIMNNDHKVEEIKDLRSLHKEFSLEGKVALVTGAAGGIGRSTAAGFAEMGAKVVLMDLPRQEEKLQAYCDQIRERYDAEVSYVMGDVSDEESVNSFVAETVARYGKIDILHNNAGFSFGGGVKIAEMPVEKWQASLNVNLTGIFLVGRAVANQMRKQGTGGSIINTASMSGCILLDQGSCEAFYIGHGTGIHQGQHPREQCQLWRSSFRSASDILQDAGSTCGALCNTGQEHANRTSGKPVRNRRAGHFPGDRSFQLYDGCGPSDRRRVLRRPLYEGSGIRCGIPAIQIK